MSDTFVPPALTFVYLQVSFTVFFIAGYCQSRFLCIQKSRFPCEIDAMDPFDFPQVIL